MNLRSGLRTFALPHLLHPQSLVRLAEISCPPGPGIHGCFRWSAVRDCSRKQSPSRTLRFHEPPTGKPSSAVSSRGVSKLVMNPAEGAEVAEAESKTAVAEDLLVQYVVIRRDLVSESSWPLGSIITQGCHAAVAAIWLSKDDPDTALYCGPENLDQMHKVVLEVKGEIQLRNVSQKLEEAGIVHKLWTEQPENFPTCLATKPYRKSKVAQLFKKLKLCK